MGSRRRNSLVLSFVVILTAASLYAISAKETVLGLDLSGGTELVYQASPTPQNPTIEPTDIDRAIEIIRDRIDALGVSEPEIARSAPIRSRSACPTSRTRSGRSSRSATRRSSTSTTSSRT